MKTTIAKVHKYNGRTRTSNKLLTMSVLGSLRLLTAVALVSGTLLWVSSLSHVQLLKMNDIGLLSILPITYYLALIVIIISYCLNIFTKEVKEWVLFAHLLLIILVFHATPQILYGTLRYTWAWKHVGIIEYIQRHHQVNPSVNFLNAYHNWPGFFALNALFVETAGLKNALSYAGWAPFVFNLMFVCALIFLIRAFTSDQRIIWLTALFFVLCNWVGQDYLAPQAFCFFLYLVILGVLLNWFRGARAFSGIALKSWLHNRPIESFLGFLFQKHRDTRQMPQLLPLQLTMLMTLVILLMFVVTFSHQLTPVLMIFSLVYLVLFQQIHTRSLPVLMIVLESVWIFFFATAFVAPNLKSVLLSFGTVDNNFSQNFINLSAASLGQTFVAWVDRSLTALVFLLAGMGFLRRVRVGYVDLTAVLLLGSACSLLVVNSYGGEILFRVYFFALPFLAFFISCLLIPKPDYQPGWRTISLTVLLSVVMISGFLFAYYGKERQYYFTPQEVAASKYLFNIAPPGSLIIEESGNYPSLFHDYEYYTHIPISFEPLSVRQKILQRPAEVLSTWMSDTSRYTAAYFIVTRSQKAEIEMEGALPPGAGTKIEQEIAKSGQFDVLYQNRDAAIYVLKGQLQP